MTDERLREIQQHLDETTHGTWKWSGGRQFTCGHQGDSSVAYRQQDARFIVLAKNEFVAELLAEVYRLRGENGNGA